MTRTGVSLFLLAAVGIGLTALTAAPRAESGARVRTDFTPEQEKQIEALVRQYILQHPEIIPEAVAELQRREVVKVLETYRKDIETPFPGAVAGNPQGDVTLVEFFDFRCPYCRRSHASLKELIASDANLRVIYRDLPILDQPGTEPLSRRAALMALAAGRQGRYLQMHDAIFSIEGRITQEKLVAAARKAGVNERRLAEDMNDPALEQELNKNLQLGGALGFSGTPTYIVGDQIISGAVDPDELRNAIAKARSARNGE